MENKENSDYDLINFNGLQAETIYDALQAYCIYHKLNHKKIDKYKDIQKLLHSFKNSDNETLNLTFTDTILFAKSLHFILHHKDFFNTICKVGQISYKNIYLINKTLPKLNQKLDNYNAKCIAHSMTFDDINTNLDHDIQLIKIGETRKSLDNIFKNLDIDSTNESYHPYDLLSVLALDTNRRKPLGKNKDFFVLKSVILGTIHYLKNAPENDSELSTQFNLLCKYKDAQHKGIKYIICTHHPKTNQIIVTPVDENDGIKFIKVMKLVNQVIASK